MTLLLLSFLASLTPAGYADVTPNFSPTLQLLRNEAQKDPATQTRAERARTEASEGFTGEKPPFNVYVLAPVEFVDVPGAPRGLPPPQEPPANAPRDAPADGRPSYHFEGKSVLPGLSIYTPVRDTGGAGDETRAPPAPAGLGTYAAAIGLALGAAMIASFFAPPLLVVGALAIAAALFLFLRR